MKMSEFDECKNFKLFVKFTNEKYVDDLLNGNIFMNNINYFIELERKQKSKGIGDRREASFVIEPEKIYFLDVETNKVMGRPVKAEIIRRYDKATQVPIFCYTMLTAEDFVLFEDNDDQLIFKLDIGEDLHMFSEFGDTAVILPSNFHDLLIESAEKQDVIARVAGVNYQTFDKIDTDKEKLFNKGSIEMFYWKHEDFMYQREMRFVLPNTFVEDNFAFKTDNIEAQSIVIPIAEFLERSVIIATKRKKVHS